MTSSHPALLFGLFGILTVSPAHADEVRVQRVIPADSAGAPPAGYHAEERMRTGLVIGGAVTSAVGALFLLAGREQQGNESQAEPSGDVDSSPIFYVFGGLHLAVGIPLLTFGLLDSRDVYVRDEARLQITPQIGPGYSGGSMRLVF